MTPQDAHRLVGHETPVSQRLEDIIRWVDGNRACIWVEKDVADLRDALRSLIPDPSDHAAIDAIAARAGLHRGTVAKVIEAMRRT
jgi:hypothetical protein